MIATSRSARIGLACLIALGIVTLAHLATDSQVSAAAAVHRQVRDGAAPPSTGTSVLVGLVVSDDEGRRPIRRALVTISSAEARGQRIVNTDDTGHFQVAGLPTGTYTAVVSKPGYVSSYYGSRRPGRAPGTPFTLADGERRDLTIPLMHGAAVTGVITDPFGRPLPDIRVSVLELRTVNGERRLVTVPGPNANTTDERGIYRLWGLPSGTFLVSAAPNGLVSNAAVRQITSTDLDWARQQLTSGRAGTSPAPDAGHTVGYATVYFPGVVDATSASQLVVSAGQERSGLDFSLQLVPTAVIDGTVIGQDGQPVTSGTQVLLTRAQGPQLAGAGVAAPFLSRGVGLDRLGKFSLAGVEPGQYTLTARGSSRQTGPPAPPPPPPGVPGLGLPGLAPPPLPPQPSTYELWATLDVSVAGDDLSGLVLTLRPGMTVSGRVTFEGTSPPIDDLTRVRVGLTPATNDGISFNVSAKPGAANGTFTLTGVTPGRYRPTASVAAPAGGRGTAPVPAGPTSWRLKSAMWQGRDLLDLLLDVHPNEDVSDVTLTFTDLTTELSGSLLGAAGDPASGYIVLVFPVDSSLWLPNSRRIRQIQPAPDGTYKATNLPSGTYCLGAVTDADSGDLSDPSFLEQVAAASLRITITDGGKTVQNLRVKGG
jgi:hypothetical protein